MVCGFLEKDVIRYKDKELSQKKNAAFEKHLESCDKCRKKLKLLEQMESYVSESAAPKNDIAGATVSCIKQGLCESRPSRRKRLPFSFKRFALPVFGVILIAVTLVTFRQPLISGLGSLIGSKYSTQNPGMLAGNPPDQYQTAEEPGITSIPVVDPDTKPAEGTLFAIYKSSVSMEEIYGKYTDGSLAEDGNPYAIPYDSVLIDQIPLDDKPLLTDGDIEAYYDGTMIFKCRNSSTLDYFYYGYVSVQPLPIVIEIDGKRVAWGAFMSPISSLSPPYEAFRLGLYPLGDPGSDGSYFSLSASDAERLSKIEGLISRVFTYAGKLADKSEAPSDLTDVQIIEQGSGPQNPTAELRKDLPERSDNSRN